VPERRRSQRERVEDSTRRLLEAAEELISEVGYEAATAAEIGRRAGFSRAMVSARFGSKQQLVEALIRSAYDAPLDATLSRSRTGLEQVLARVEMLARAVSERPHIMRLIFASEFRAASDASAAPVSAWVSRLRAETREAIRAGQLDGSIRPDLDAADIAHALDAFGFGSAFLWSIDPAADFERRVERWKSWISTALGT
jgi:AcrR family transcriptional regulator